MFVKSTDNALEKKSPILLQENSNNHSILKMRSTTAEILTFLKSEQILSSIRQYELQNVRVKAMFTLTAFEIFLFEGRSVSSPIQRRTRSKKF